MWHYALRYALLTYFLHIFFNIGFHTLAKRLYCQWLKDYKPMIEMFFWSLLAITWASYGMHVIKEYIRNHIN